jgi:hypothetical protein
VHYFNRSESVVAGSTSYPGTKTAGATVEKIVLDDNGIKLIISHWGHDETISQQLKEQHRSTKVDSLRNRRKAASPKVDEGRFSLQKGRKVASKISPNTDRRKSILSETGNKLFRKVVAEISLNEGQRRSILSTGREVVSKDLPQRRSTKVSPEGITRSRRHHPKVSPKGITRSYQDLQPGNCVTRRCHFP